MDNDILIEKINFKLRQGQINEAAQLIQSAVALGINFRGNHVLYAHVLIANIPWAAISSLLPAGTNRGGEEVQIGTKKVKTRTLEDLLPEDVDFLKIDIDGMEGALLLPLVHFIQNKNIRIFIELESEFLLDYEREMRAIGYTISHRTDHGNYSNLFLQRAIG